MAYSVPCLHKCLTITCGFEEALSLNFVFLLVVKLAECENTLPRWLCEFAITYVHMYRETVSSTWFPLKGEISKAPQRLSILSSLGGVALTDLLNIVRRPILKSFLRSELLEPFVFLWKFNPLFAWDLHVTFWCFPYFQSCSGLSSRAALDIYCAACKNECPHLSEILLVLYLSLHNSRILNYSLDHIISPFQNFSDFPEKIANFSREKPAIW